MRELATSTREASRRLAVAALAALCLAGCARSDEAPALGPERSGSPDVVVAQVLERVQRERRRAALEEGWRSAWPQGYARSVETARDAWPGAFQREVAGTASLLGGAALALGLLVGFLALGAPRSSRRGPPERASGRAVDAAGRALGRLGRGVGAVARGVAAEVPQAAAERASREAARHVAALRRVLKRRRGRGEADRTLDETLSAWAGELERTRREAWRLAAMGAERHIDGLVALLAADAELADELRVQAQRAEASREGVREAQLAAWARTLEDREPLPPPAGTTEPPEWAAPAARLGLICVGLGLLAAAAWSAAGALPAFLAIPALACALLLRLTARAAHARGAGPALARRRPTTHALEPRHLEALLTLLGAAALVCMTLSSSARVASGLDLGSPPPLRVAAAEPAPDPPPELVTRVTKTPAP
ncbi:MAG: hypothetical protein H6744_08490 [Deltaproteobacteria bacterium]|nr:hypothetical protein [Deltaproteobacteria bacterium]MCB9786715.1 hypothetical protein [Deltaproteobacteria bacterium]